DLTRRRHWPPRQRVKYVTAQRGAMPRPGASAIATVKTSMMGKKPCVPAMMESRRQPDAVLGGGDLGVDQRLDVVVVDVLLRSGPGSWKAAGPRSTFWCRACARARASSGLSCWASMRRGANGYFYPGVQKFGWRLDPLLTA